MFKRTFVTVLIATATALPVVSLSATRALAGDDVGFTLVNGTTYTLTNFYASPTGVNNWENDIMGSDTLPPGGKVYVNINDARDVCNYDVKGTFSDGNSAEQYQIDFCDLDGGTYTFTEE
jgi:hypothetical protein